LVAEAQNSQHVFGSEFYICILLQLDLLDWVSEPTISIKECNSTYKLYRKLSIKTVSTCTKIYIAHLGYCLSAVFCHIFGQFYPNYVS